VLDASGNRHDANDRSLVLCFECVYVYADGSASSPC
jgi:hypothetical protein